MATATVDISDNSQKLLSELVLTTGQTAADVVQQALDAYRRQVFFKKVNEGYADLRADPASWAAYQAEFKEWESLTNAGLEQDEHWTEDGRCHIKPAE